MGKITIPPGSNEEVWMAIATIAGSALENIGYDSLTDELHVPDVDQADLDSALATYNADPAAGDAGWAQKKSALRIGRNQQRFDSDGVTKAVLEAVRDEINVLRQQHSLPDISAGAFEGSVRDKIANP